MNIDWSEEDGWLITRRSHLLAPETQALIWIIEFLLNVLTLLKKNNNPKIK